MVTCCEEIWQHCLEALLLEEEVAVPVYGQEHERQQCRLDKAYTPIASRSGVPGCLQVDNQLLICLGAIRVEILQQHGNEEAVCP